MGLDCESYNEAEAERRKSGIKSVYFLVCVRVCLYQVCWVGCVREGTGQLSLVVYGWLYFIYHGVRCLVIKREEPRQKRREREGERVCVCAYVRFEMRAD